MTTKTTQELQQIIKDLYDSGKHGLERDRAEFQAYAKLLSLIAKHEAELVEYILPRVEKFIRKVETGRARSVETYQDMKDIRAKLTALTEKESKE